jgi:hypothetical protein
MVRFIFIYFLKKNIEDKNQYKIHRNKQGCRLQRQFNSKTNLHHFLDRYLIKASMIR